MVVCLTLASYLCYCNLLVYYTYPIHQSHADLCSSSLCYHVPEDSRLSHPPARFSAMVPPRASLLGLPRELRNIIFFYLEEDITIPWLYLPANDTVAEPKAVDIKVHNAPCTDLSLVSPQLRHEYMHFTNNVTATIDVAMVTCGIIIERERDVESEIAIASAIPHPAAFAYISRATIFLHYLDFSTSTSTRQIMWGFFSHLVEALVAQAPKLCTLRIVAHHHRGHMVQHDELRHLELVRENSRETRRRYFTNPPVELAGMKVKKGGEGYRVDFGSVDVVQHGTSKRLMHRISKIAVYMYERGDGKGEEVLTQEIMHGPEATREYGDEALELMGEDEREEVRRWPREIREWGDFSAGSNSVSE
jgi:hypothetical protein